VCAGGAARETVERCVRQRLPRAPFLEHRAQPSPHEAVKLALIWPVFLTCAQQGAETRHAIVIRARQQEFAHQLNRCAQLTSGIF
jgi:hypothetical protein